MAKILTDQLHLDSVKSTYGDSGDLQIYHDGSNSYIADSGTGFLNIQSDAALVLANAAGEPYFIGTSNGSVKLYYDNSTKFETTSTGVTVTGNASMATGHSSGKFAVMSTSVHGSYDFYNNGTSYFNGAVIIDNNLDMTSDGVIKMAGTEVISAARHISATTGTFTGNVSVNNLALPDGHDIGWDGGFSSNKPTLAANGTTMKMYPSGSSGGVQFSLTPTTATFAGNVSLNDNAELQIGNSNDFYIKHDATDTILNNGVGKLKITNNAVDKAILFSANESSGAELYLGLLPSFPGVFVYKDLLMASDGLKLRMGASQDLEIFHDGSNSYVSDTGTGSLILTGTDLQLKSAGDEFYMYCTADGQVALYHNGTKKFETGSTGVTIVGNINVSGTVDGRDVASDGSKLDGIASGATANAGTVTSVSASTATNAKGLSVSSGTTTPVVGLDIVGMGDYADGFDDGSIDYSQVFVPICDDDNGGGNKKTSVKSLLEGGVDSKHQFVLNSNFSDDTSSTGLFYMPFNSLSDTTSGQYYVHWAAPCTGRIKRVIMQHVYGSMSSGFTTQLQVYKNGSTFATSNELTVSTTNDGGYIEWNPGGSNTGNVSFVKGDRIRIRYQKSATGKYWRGVAASIIIELDQV